VLQTHRYRVLPRQDGTQRPLELARHIVDVCAEGPVAFRATLKTARRELVAQLSALIQPPSASVGTFSRLMGPHDVPLDDPPDGSTLAFIEQPGPQTGLLQQWVTHYVAAGDGGSATTLHLRIDRDDPHSLPAVLERLRACQDVGVLPREADVEGAVHQVLTGVTPDHSRRVPLGRGSLLAQSFFEGSPAVLLNLELRMPGVTASLLRADIWRPGEAVELRRYSTLQAALRVPHAASYELHTEVDGPLTDALVAARAAGEALTVEWEIGGESELSGVSVVDDAEDGAARAGDGAGLHVELDVACHVDWEYGPDADEAVAPFALRAGLALRHLGAS
jgi:hypothetical protein